jgi:hypothetical protein
VRGAVSDGRPYRDTDTTWCGPTDTTGARCALSYDTRRGLAERNRSTAPRPKQIASNNGIEDVSGTALVKFGLNSSVKLLASGKDGSMATWGSADALKADP